MKAPRYAMALPDRKGGWSWTHRLQERLSRFMAAASWTGTRSLPSRTTALRRLEPITAPSPERAAMRPRSLKTPEMRERRSPAGPMTATRAPAPCPARSMASVSVVSLPQRCEASRSSALPFLT
ncbi:MAG: hypothetical protein A4E67_01555 [Syntrophaceae bacterium PtaB.Bin038]|nr:MAG: hypothetical protein A4E67_01555 [Syntrophaceae bacterium PtaB.Bin038]